MSKQILHSKYKDERDEIVKKLNTFYGPFKELRMMSNILYSKLALEIKEKLIRKGKNFRTLEYLLDGKKFNRQDDEILRAEFNLEVHHPDERPPREF